MKNIRPATDYKISCQITEYFAEYNEISKCVEMLSEKIDNTSLSPKEMDMIHQELDENMGKLEEVSGILADLGYIRLYD